MSKSPEHPTWKDDFPEIPRAGVIWPWMAVGLFCFLTGLYLVFTPVVREDGGGGSQASPTTAPRETPSQQSPSTDGRVIRFAFVDSDHSTFAFAAEAFARRVSELSRGRVQVQTLPGGLIEGKRYDELEIVKQIQQGHLEMGLSTTSPLTNYNPDFEVLDLPFLFQDYDHADRVLDGPLGQLMAQGLEKHGLRALGYLELGFRIYSSSVPLETLEDFSGKKIRVMQSATYVRLVKALGAEAVPAPVDKIYRMGQEGFIDAADRTYPTYWDFKLYEVHRFITESRHTYSAKAILINQDLFESLPEEEQGILEEAARYVQRLQRKKQRAAEENVKRQCKEEEITIFTLSDAEREKFLTAVAPVYEEYRSLGDPRLLDQIQEQAEVSGEPEPGETPLPEATPEEPQPEATPDEPPSLEATPEEPQPEATPDEPPSPEEPGTGSTPG